MTARTDFGFSNLCGGVYMSGQLIFVGKGLLSPVGNRVAYFDLENNRNFTFPFEARHHIKSCDLAEARDLLVLADASGRITFVNFQAQVNLESLRVTGPIRSVKISPNGQYVALGCGMELQIWTTPQDRTRHYHSVHLHAKHQFFGDAVTSIQWTPDSRYLLVACADALTRIIPLNMPRTRERAYVTLTVHRAPLLGAWWATKECNMIITVAKDKSVGVWKITDKKRLLADKSEWKFDMGKEKKEESLKEEAKDAELVKNSLIEYKWDIVRKHVLKLSNRICSANYHREASMLVVGLYDGNFALYAVDGVDVNLLHTLSVSAQRISSISINETGDWIALGSSRMGQLLVWEWRTEEYRLKQQSHHSNDMNVVAYSPDGALVATGGEDGRVKVWKGTHGYCTVTFREHSGPIVALQFNDQNALFTASVDGTIRGFELLRYRQFRVYTTPEPVQFSCMALDPSYEVIAAGSSSVFDVFVWSVKTGRLLEVCRGHTGPVPSLVFSPVSNILATASWDKTVRVWALYGSQGEDEGDVGGKGGVESINFYNEVLQVAFSPNGERLCAVTMNGEIHFLDTSDPSDVKEMHSGIDVSRDIKGGVRSDVQTNAYGRNAGNYVNTISFSADGKLLLCGGNTKWLCLYDVQERFLVRKWPVTHNESFEGVREYKKWKELTDGGALEVFDLDTDTDDDSRPRKMQKLPGVQRGEHAQAKRTTRLLARSKCVVFSPTGREWAAATTDGLLIYGLDAQQMHAFHPLRLTYGLTPQAIRDAVRQGKFLQAMQQALQLNDEDTKREVFHSIPPSEVIWIAQQLSVEEVKPMVQLLAQQAQQHIHVEFIYTWALELLKHNWEFLQKHKVEYRDALKSVLQSIVQFTGDVNRITDENTHALRFVQSMGVREAKAQTASTTQEQE